MANLIRWEPFRDFITLREAMNRLFEDSFVRPLGLPALAEGEAETFRMPLDIYETDDDLIVEASMPGIDPKNVEISVTGSTLTIKGEMRKEENKEEKGKFFSRERGFGTCQRTFNLPVEVNADKAEAAFENGILKLILPKVVEAKPKKINVKITK